MKRFDSPLEAFAYWLERAPQRPFLRQPVNRVYITYTYQEADREIRKMASALKSLGLEPKSHIALLSKNCAHWIMADLAIMVAGLVSVPIYPTLGAGPIRDLLIHSDSKAVIIGKLDNYEHQKDGIPDILKIGIERYGIREEYCWEDLVLSNDPLQEIPEQRSDDVMTIIYTSGTTGDPKGVMHVTGSFGQLINTSLDVMELPGQLRYFSYLPLTHIAERAGIELSAIYRGATISFFESLDTFAEDLAATQPHTFFGTPRVWAKLQEKVLQKVPRKKLDMLLGLPFLGKVIRKKIRKKLGLDKSVVNYSGGASIAISLQEWFARLGIIIYQGYGMTEDCILSHYNLPGANKFGTVGRPLPGVTSKLSPEGEICIKSNCLMKGYYKEPEKTAAMFDKEGFLRTGDLGRTDHDGYLTITGRVKDRFKTDKGKYISPVPIEVRLLKNPDIEQVCLVGTGIPQPMVLIIPSESGRKKSRARFSASILSGIDQLNSGLEPFEKIAGAIIMKEDWTIENGLLTPTLKVKRRGVEAICQHRYREWFEKPERVVYEN